MNNNIEEPNPNFINLIENIDIYSINDTDYSKYEFHIETSECTSCNVDGYTVILNNYNIFKSFLNLKSIYLLKIFNMFKNIVNNI